MKVENKRVAHTEKSTLGILSINDKIVGFVLEDEPREVKIKGQTRIPAGEYEIKFRKSLTPLTAKYRKKFDWFTYHLELQNVPNFTGIYIHIGNYETDTDGCQLVGKGASIHFNNYMILNSTVMFRKIYKIISDELKKGNRVTYKIVNDN